MGMAGYILTSPDGAPDKRTHATRDKKDFISLQEAGGRVMRGVRCLSEVHPDEGQNVS
jgi:hypothetical protein